MVTKQAKDIITIADDLVKFWKLRDDRILKDRDLLHLRKPPYRSDKIQWVSNEPKVFYETAVSLVSSYQPRFRMPLTINYTPEDKDRMNKAERMILGIFRELDRRQVARGQVYWLREFAWNVLSGWYSVFTYVRRNGKAAEFVADIWDPIHCYPEWDEYGLSQLVRTYQVDARTAISMASEFQSRGLEFEMPELKKEDRPRIINYWKRTMGKEGNVVSNSILIGDTQVKPLTPHRQFNEIPVFIGGIGSPDKTAADWQARRGESILAADRDIYGYENTMLSLMAKIMVEQAYPNILEKSTTGAPLTKGGLKGYGDRVSMRVQERIEILRSATTPEEAGVLLSYFGKQRQKGSLPEIVYGGVPFELSGFAISQLMASIRYKMAPYLRTMQSVISSISSEFLDQYANGDENGRFPPIKLVTDNPTELKKGLFFVEEFTTKDVPDNRYVEVTIPVTTALDKTQRIQYARQALAPPRLLSRETLWDDPEMLDVQDSEQEYARITQDEILDMPIMKQLMTIEELRNRVEQFKKDKKMSAAMALEKYIKGMELELGMRKPETQAKPAGIPPEVLPPEMTGENPDVQRAIAGTPPPGLRRRPQTPEERAESKRKIRTMEV